MKRMNLLVIMVLGVTGMLYAKPVDPNDPNKTRYTGQAGYYAYRMLADYGFTAADILHGDFAPLRAELSKKGLATKEDYAMALYQDALKSSTHKNYRKALAALWEILSDESMIKAAKNVELLDRVERLFQDNLKAKPAKLVDPTDPDKDRYTGMAGYYAYNVLRDYGFTAADIPKGDFAPLRAGLSKKGLTTKEAYARALYEEALKSSTHNNYSDALAALWEILSDESMIQAAENAHLLRSVVDLFGDVLAKVRAKLRIKA